MVRAEAEETVEHLEILSKKCTDLNTTRLRYLFSVRFCGMRKASSVKTLRVCAVSVKHSVFAQCLLNTQCLLSVC